MNNRRKLFVDIAQSIGVTIISFVIAISALSGLESLLDFRSSIQGDTFEISDVYNYVADNRDVRNLSDDVTIISIDGCDRQDIATLIPAVESLKPGAIGLDVLFFQDFDGDEELINSLNSASNLVLPILLDNESGSTTGSYFYNQLADATFGIINLNVDSNNQPVRTFKPHIQFNDMKVNTFAAELASIVDEGKYNELIKRANEAETICYPSTEFYTISYMDFLESPESFAQNIHNKVILLGDTNQGNDFHVTPISSGIPGVQIHAHIIDTIINSKYVRTSPSWLNWSIGFILCFILIFINFRIWDKIPLICNIVTRIIQVACLYCFFALGCKVYVGNYYCIDFSPILLMAGLDLFAYDLWVGLVAVFRLLFKKKVA